MKVVYCIGMSGLFEEISKVGIKVLGLEDNDSMWEQDLGEKVDAVVRFF